MYDRYNRNINYLRISVTDRCNLRCRYCMPAEGVSLMSHKEILSFDEIVSFTRQAVSRGVTKVRITGGEPLVRKGIVDLVKMIGDIDEIDDLSMTSNAILLGKLAVPLKEAGLKRINISLDTMDAASFESLTRGGDINDALEGIDAAIDAGLTPVKINCVIKNNHNEPDAMAVAEFARIKGIELRYIKEMSLSGGRFSIVEGGDGGNCKICNRIRLTASGMVKPCLFNNLEYSVRELGNEKALSMALDQKPECGSVNNTSNFYNLGG
jgi:cyclic pyranopterin phosphate synthase